MGWIAPVPPNAQAWTYIRFPECTAQMFDDYISGLKDYFCTAMPSLIPVDNRPAGRDYVVIAENSLAVIGISAYANVLAVWIVPYDDHPQLARHWVSQIAHYVDALEKEITA